MNAIVTERTREEDIMTDFQFKAIMFMVLEIIKSKDNLEDAKQAIAKIANA